MPLKNLDKEEYISLTEATEYCDCTRQYLSLCARQGKLKAEKISMNWVTTKEWVEEYFGKTNSDKARSPEKKTKVKAKTKAKTKAKARARAFSSLADRYFSVVNSAFREISKRIKKSKTIFSRPELRRAIAIVLLFIFLGAGFVWKGGTLFATKDLFIDGFAIFSEEASNGIDRISKDAGEVSNTFANFSNTISENFPSTITGARAVIQNFRDGKNYAVNKLARVGQTIATGAENTALAISNIPSFFANGIFLIVGDGAENRIFAKSSSAASRFFIVVMEITDNAFYGLGYTGRMVKEYTQWLNQKFVQESLYAAKENVALGAVSILNGCESFYNKYDSKLFK